MKFRTAVAFLSLCAAPVLANPATTGTMDEARAMAERAAALITERGGIEAACPEFSQPVGPFRDRDLYVWAWRTNGRVACHAVSPALVGRDMIEMRDVGGSPLGRNIVAITDRGWVDYRWQNPQTRVVEAKSSYVIRVGDTLVGVGAYRP